MELKALGVPVLCLESRQVRAAMSAQRNKTTQPTRWIWRI